MARALDNISIEQAELSGWTIYNKKNANKIEYITKGSYQDNELRIMKTLKKIRVPGGWIYNISTEATILNDEKPINISVAETAVFVPSTYPVQENV